MQDIHGATPKKIAKFKQLCLQAAIQTSANKDGFGILCDERLGKETLYQASDYNIWIGRPVELPGSRPLRFEPQIGVDCGGFGEWPRNHIVKCLCLAHPDDEEALWYEQLEQVLRLYTASRRNNLEFLLEIVPSKIGNVSDETTAQVMTKFYSTGIFPDWWKLEPTNSHYAWQNITKVIQHNDPNIKGIVILGLEASEDVLEQSFNVAAQQPFVNGFAVGRTIFSETAKSWMIGKIDDSQAIHNMSHKYKRLCDLWDAANMK